MSAWRRPGQQRQAACSAKRRETLSQQQEEAARRNRDAEIRGLLEAALRLEGEATDEDSLRGGVVAVRVGAVVNPYI